MPLASRYPFREARSPASTASGIRPRARPSQKGEGAEEVSWQLGHKDSTVTRKVYVQEVKSAERSARRREQMEQRCGRIVVAK
jgi:hypothetical protein